MKSLLSSQSPITRPARRENVERLLFGSFDVALFYFAGHGMINGAGGCVVTQDATRYDEGISMAEILALANRSPSREVIIILDCCHSGACGALPAIDSPHAHLREGVLVLCASSSTESAAEIDARGVFTGLVVEALYGGASDLLGRIIMADVFHTHESEYKLDRHTRAMTTFQIVVRRTYTISCASTDLLGLVRGTTEQDLYFAVMSGGSCRLTKLGQYYWHLVKQHRI